MKKLNKSLRSARIKKSWTQEFVSQQVGVSLNTYVRWETGQQMPRSASLHALCKVFSMSAEELGFRSRGEDKVGTVIEEEWPDYSEYAVQIGIENEPVLSDSMEQRVRGIAGCWNAYFNGEQVAIELLLPSYVTELRALALIPGQEQEVAARMLSQVYQLRSLLKLQRGDFIGAQTSAKQGIIHSQLANDWNTYIAAQIRLASIASVRKQNNIALNAYHEALRRINGTQDIISPILHCWIFGGLAEQQALMGNDKEALQFLQLAFATFPDQLYRDPSHKYTHGSASLLFQYEGLVYLRLGQPKQAWAAFSQIDEQLPRPNRRTRAEFLGYKALTSLMLGNMIQSCIYLEALVKAAHEIHSDLLQSEAFALFEQLLARWGQEPRVRGLIELFHT